jgi:hypothetical protein
MVVCIIERSITHYDNLTMFGVAAVAASDPRGGGREKRAI